MSNNEGKGNGTTENQVIKNPDGKGQATNTRKNLHEITGSPGQPVPGTTLVSAALEKQKQAPRVEVTTDRQFIGELIATSNELRAKHGSPPLEIDEDLCQVAQSWANALAKKGSMSHSTNGFGENIWWGTGKDVTGKHVVEAWYSEIKLFDWKRIDRKAGAGHFTQLIWKSTEKCGCAMASGTFNGTVKIFVVANYTPVGNIRGKYKQNIFPPNASAD